MKFALLGLYLAAVGLDFYLTARNIRAFGIRVELNPLIRWLHERVGLEAAVMLGLFLPSVVLAAVTWPWDLLFGVVVGFRLCFAFLQIYGTLNLSVSGSQ